MKNFQVNTIAPFQINPIDPAVKPMTWKMAHLPWSEIPRGYHLACDSGQRLCMYWDSEYGAVFGPWHGPNCTVCPSVHQR